MYEVIETVLIAVIRCPPIPPSVDLETGSGDSKLTGVPGNPRWLLTSNVFHLF